MGKVPYQSGLAFDFTADFGTRKQVEAFCAVSDQRSMRSSDYFTAPEVFDGNYGNNADIWSLGGLLYLMVTNELP